MKLAAAQSERKESKQTHAENESVKPDDEKEDVDGGKESESENESVSVDLSSVAHEPISQRKIKVSKY